MRVNTNRLFECLGLPTVNSHELVCQTCKQPTLRVSADRRSDATLFSCSGCGFHGDAVQFTAFVRQESIADVLQHFAPGHPLHEALEQPLSHTQWQAYMEQYQSQAHIQSYIQQLHTNLQTRTGANAIQTWGAFSGGRCSPPDDMGLISSDSAPPELPNLDYGKYHKQTHVSFAYRFNSRVSGVGVRPIQGPSNHEFLQIGPVKLGVFMEGNVTAETQQLYVASDDYAAAALYNRAQQTNRQPLPIISVAALPLPVKISHVTELQLISVSDHPLRLNTALEYYTVHQLFEVPAATECFVLDLNHPLIDVSPTMLRQAATKKELLVNWIARQLQNLFEFNGDSDIVSTLHAYKITTLKQTELTQALRKNGAPEPLITLVERLNTVLIDERRLANGRRILRTANGFVGYNKELPINLSDTTFKIAKCLYTREGNILYETHVYCPRAKTHPVVAVLAESDFRNETTLKSAIQRALISKMENVPVTFYKHTGYSWPEIRDVFGDCPTVTPELATLGWDDQFQLNLPYAKLNIPNDSVEDQRPLITFRPEVVSCYQAVRPHAISDLSGVPALWQTDLPEYGAMAAGLCHVICECIAGLHAARSGTAYHPKHLVYVDLTKQTWMPAMKQLASVLRGNEFLPALPAAYSVDVTRQHADLGCLPYLCNFPELSAARARELVYHSAVSLLTLIDSSNGEAIAGCENVWFIALERMNPRMPELLPDELIADLQREFPYLLQLVLTNVYRQKNFNFSNVNVLTVYESVARILGVTPANAVANMFKRYYTAFSYANARAFFMELRKMFYDGGRAYSPQVKLRGAELPNEAFAVFEHTETGHVYVHQQLLEVINCQHGKLNFDRKLLEEELVEADYLALEPKAPYWVLKADVWRTHVANQLQILPALKVS